MRRRSQRAIAAPLRFVAQDLIAFRIPAVVLRHDGTFPDSNPGAVAAAGLGSATSVEVAPVSRSTLATETAFSSAIRTTSSIDDAVLEQIHVASAGGVVAMGAVRRGPVVRHAGDERVTVWYTAPTAIRMLMKAGPAEARARDLSALRFLASVGEPLNPEAVTWSHATYGIPFHDNWWQRPRIVLAAGSDAAKARSLVDAAHAACVVANSITASVRIEPGVGAA